MNKLTKRDEYKTFFGENIFSSFFAKTKNAKENVLCSIFGAQNSLKSAVALSLDGKILYLAINGIFAQNAYERLEEMGLKVFLFPSIFDSFLYKSVQSNEQYKKRVEALNKILTGDYDVIVAETSALTSFLPNPEIFGRSQIILKKSQSYDISSIEKLLILAGYQKEEMIFDNGQFSRRGEILDIYPTGSKYAFRIDFFDDEIETIKIFDLQSQKPTKELSEIQILPCSDIFFEDEEIKILNRELEKLKKKNSSEIFLSQVDELLLRINRKDKSFELDCVKPYLDSYKFNLLDYLCFAKDKFSIVIEECKGCYDSLVTFEKDCQDRTKDLKASKELIAGENAVCFSKNEIIKKIEKCDTYSFLKITNQNRFFEPKQLLNLKSLPFSRFLSNKKDLAVELKKYLAENFKVYIFSGDKDQAVAIKNILNNFNLEIEISKSFDFDKQQKCIVFENFYENGFILPDEKIVVVGTYDIFAKKAVSKQFVTSAKSYFVPKIGDFVVHHIHGIGKCEGITTLSTPLGIKDYVVVSYAGGDKLYVPTTQMDLLDKFSGTSENVKLSKIGGQEFLRTKERVKESIKKLAFSLLDLYAEREKVKGFCFSEDNSLMSEFENAFAYSETEDQLLAVRDIKNDMQSQKVMDRLICGDVGFGKTEVAMRACFKAVIDGKQVAFVAPTTILSEQHFNTLLARMNDFGVKIAVLNRFKTSKEANKIIDDLKLGKIDILVGTHRLFSKDIEFANLGIIVLDEEQKFGVEHKEKLKNDYKNVDVLTLSATPIPRTLNMALTKIRDISIIATPPSERLPIQTYVIEYSESLVKDAINRELLRDGQVFVLFNSVEKIYAFADSIQKLVPEAKILVAHGQMNATEMENVIYDFYHRKADILVCTTIIENGIDIENANTLIVYDADKLGLSQLYQLRGRVGRGSKVAFAYFTYQKQKVLSDEAYKRLDAISEFCEFGSGFKLAMRDLEIRGGGNILGPEQSGHLQKVGYEMYAKLLNEAVQEIKGEKINLESEDVLVKVAIDAFVPDTYVATSEERMTVYKQISNVSSVEDMEKLKLELINSFGAVPREVENLLKISLARKIAKKLGACEIVSFGAEVSVVFDDKSKIAESEVLADVIYKFRADCAIDFSAKPKIRFDKEKLASANFENLLKFLLVAKKLIKD